MALCKRQAKDPTPWRSYKGEKPTWETLARWRLRATELARSRGAKWACGLCKRPLGPRGAHGWVRLWWQKKRDRRVCYACWVTVGHLLDHMEATLHRDHLPMEVGERKG